MELGTGDSPVPGSEPPLELSMLDEGAAGGFTSKTTATARTTIEIPDTVTSRDLVKNPVLAAKKIHSNRHAKKLGPSRNRGNSARPSEVPPATTQLPATTNTDHSITPNNNNNNNNMNNDSQLVTECATIYSVLMFAITSSYPALYLYFARTGDEKVEKFWGWILLPVAAAVMAISFALKPRRTDKTYIALLYLQYGLFTIVSEIFDTIGKNYDSAAVFHSVSSTVLWVLVLPVAMRIRSRIAKLSNSDLSRFLTNDVLKGGILLGLAQLAFLLFASIQCDANAKEAGLRWQQCRRTLFSQTGLGGLVAIFGIIKLVSGVVPLHILTKHTVSMEKVVAMNVRLDEAVQFFGLGIATISALFLLGLYGAEGDFQSEDEEYFVISVMFIGMGALIINAL